MTGETNTSSMNAAVERRDRNRQEMRETILASARRILFEQGVASLSMRAVARDIGYSPASLYEYFPSKAVLCQSLFFEGANGLSGWMRAVTESFPENARAQDITGAMAKAYRSYALQNRELYLLVFSNPVPDFVPAEGDRRKASDGFDLLTSAILRGAEQGDMHVDNPVSSAIAAWTVVHGFVMLEIVGYLDGRGESADQLFQDVLTQVGRGLGK
ncbi:TetR/AcrR family transcriptional regulator [soil metagenome]